MQKKKTVLPRHYTGVLAKHPQLAEALEALGKAARKEGPLDDKTAHLVQLAAAASIRSEGAVHSHTKRALAAGARAEEIGHALLLLISTIGFPTVAAALSWVEDVIGKK